MKIIHSSKGDTCSVLMVTIQGHSGLIEVMRMDMKVEELNWAPTPPPPQIEKKSQREGRKAAIMAVLSDNVGQRQQNMCSFFATFVLWLCGQI